LTLRLFAGLLACGPIAARPLLASPLEEVRAELRQAAATGRRWVVVKLPAAPLALGSEMHAPEATVGLALPGDPSACFNAAVACQLVIFLPGMGTAPHVYGPAANPFMKAVDAEVAQGKLPNLLVAVVDGRTRYQGGLYVDSPVTGQWTSYIADELLPQLRQLTGNPLPKPIVAGHSMGGYGALHIALQRPELWRGAVAISPLLRSSLLPDRLMPVIARSAVDHGTPTIGTARNNWSKVSFSQKLLWAILAAWLPEPGLEGGVPLPFAGEGQGLHLKPEVLERTRRWDLVQRIAQDQQAAARAVGRVYLGLGAKDGLTPHQHGQEVQAAWARTTKRPKDFHLVLHQGNHTSQMADDLIAGLRFVLGGQRGLP
jgi:pimeloyl-ACP methyl ester carboxylesterase